MLRLTRFYKLGDKNDANAYKLFLLSIQFQEQLAGKEGEGLG